MNIEERQQSNLPSYMWATERPAPKLALGMQRKSFGYARKIFCVCKESPFVIYKANFRATTAANLWSVPKISLFKNSAKNLSILGINSQLQYNSSTFCYIFNHQTKEEAQSFCSLVLLHTKTMTLRSKLYTTFHFQCKFCLYTLFVSFLLFRYFFHINFHCMSLLNNSFAIFDFQKIFL